MKKLKPMTQAQLAAKFKVARQSISAWKREGVDLTDMKALEARAAAMKTRVADSEDMQAAKLRKLVADADRSQTLAARERGELVELAGIAAQGEATGRAFRRTLDRLANDLPPMLAGRAAGEIVKILKTEFRLALEKLRDTPNDQFLKIP